MNLTASYPMSSLSCQLWKSNYRISIPLLKQIWPLVSSNKPTSSSSQSCSAPDRPAPSIKVTFLKSNGERIVGYAREKENFLDVVVNNNLDIDGFGACEGTLACSTCHLVFTKNDFDRLDDKATDEELDMLDLAYGLTDTSRLGCQVSISKEFDGIEVYVPETVNDARAN
ncbi:adrenodoxin-like protein 2, mitochondrial Ferredoxin 2 [Brevipalpus obovatus]|uniref:adrenodoxin-like protein 2, mitochondrial Ferredoxin 2 n=1 Tax=Brevipalpus obovatus TaxID=246614 RepID=UPI003D9E9503